MRARILGSLLEIEREGREGRREGRRFKIED